MTNLEAFGAIYSRLEPFGAIWSQLEPFNAICRDRGWGHLQLALLYKSFYKGSEICRNTTGSGAYNQENGSGGYNIDNPDKNTWAPP